MSIYKYNMGGNTEIPIEKQVEQMKAQILSALEGGASDKEIMMMVQQSPLKDKYEFNWDNVEMKVEAWPLEGEGESDRDRAVSGAAEGAMGGIEALLGKLKSARGAAEDRFGEPDMPGQRSDNFDDGGRTRDVKDLLDYLKNYSSSSTEEEDDRFGPVDPPGQRGDMFSDGGGTSSPRTYAGQYMGQVRGDEGGRFAYYDDGDGNFMKVYLTEDVADLGDYVPDYDFIFEEVNGKMMARLAPGFEDQRNPKERKIGKQVMEESTKGSSKIENLLEKLEDGKRGTKTYKY